MMTVATSNSSSSFSGFCLLPAWALYLKWGSENRATDKLAYRLLVT